MKQLRDAELKRFLKDDRQKKPNKHEIVVIAENIQYATNVASMFRILDAVKVKEFILTGISMKPPFGKDLKKASRNKEESLNWKYSQHAGVDIARLKKQGYEIIALEVADKSVRFNERNYPEKVCLIVGSEVFGVTKNTLEKVDSAVFLPMFGKGASLNVTAALGIIVYHIAST